MKKELYYQQKLGRENVLEKFILDFFLMLASYPRLLLEVFVRKDFGIRYFRVSSVVTVAIVLFLLPTFFLPYGDAKDYIGAHFLSWYLFVIIFLLFSFMRYSEIEDNPSVFDFSRYSRYSGKDKRAFFEKVLKTSLTRRSFECFFEPMPFFIAGVLLTIFQQWIGILLAATAVFYSLGYLAAYRIGDDFVMDKIDQIIVNKNMEKDFVDGLDESETDGFHLRARRPENIDMRRRILPLLTGEDEAVEAR